jgi:hypothetical protein
MSEARSLTPLSEEDYEAIAAAVMETARGRWFMDEFAKRNRQADTAQVLAAVQRLERAMNGAAHPQPAEPDAVEAAALIADLRLDLERISGRDNNLSSGLAGRIEAAAATIVTATESIQEASWSLREAGASEALCDQLDRRATEVYAASSQVEGTAQQISKIADTIAMLDSSLRALCGKASEAAGHAARYSAAFMSDSAPLSHYEDIEVVEIDAGPVSVLAEARSVSARPASELKLHAQSLVSDDIVFEEIDGAGSELVFETIAEVADVASAAPEPTAGAAEAMAHETAAAEPAAPADLAPMDLAPMGLAPAGLAPTGLALATSEHALRELDEMSAERKLAYFA